MASIADVFFTAALDDARLQTDAKKAGNKAGLSLGQQMSSGIKKGSSDLVSGIKLGAGIAAFGGLTAAVSGTISVLGDAIQAARDDEESQARLGAALRANIPNWNGNTKAIEATIASRQRLGFTDEEQRKSLALLVVATNDVNKALEIQAAAMDLSRLRGISLEEASSALVKVEGGQFRALKALGIQLPKNATATEALAAVQRAAAGSAETYANTSQGKLLASQIKVGEAMERLGYIILPAAGAALGAIADVVADLAGLMADLAPTVTGVIGAFDTLAKVRVPVLDDIFEGINPGAAGAAVRQGIDALIAQELELLGVTERVASRLPAAWGDGLDRAAKEVDASPIALAVTQAFGSDLAALSGTAKTYGARLASAAAQGLADKINEERSVVDQAWDALLLGLKNQLTPAKERAKLIGYLASKELVAGLKSGDPAVKAQAQATKQTILDRLAALSPNAKNIGKDGMEALRKGMKSKDPDIRAASLAIYNAATAKVKTIPANMKTWGKAAGAAYAAGLRSSYGLVNDAAYYVARGATGAFRASSPPGPESPLHKIDEWGAKTIAAWADGMRSQASKAQTAAFGVVAGTAAAFAPRAPLGGSLPSMARPLPAAPSLGMAGGNTYNLTANVEGLVKARDPLEIARTLGRFARNGTLTMEPR